MREGKDTHIHAHIKRFSKVSNTLKNIDFGAFLGHSWNF